MHTGSPSSLGEFRPWQSPPNQMGHESAPVLKPTNLKAFSSQVSVIGNSKSFRRYAVGRFRMSPTSPPEPTSPSSCLTIKMTALWKYCWSKMKWLFGVDKITEPRSINGVACAQPAASLSRAPCVSEVTAVAAPPPLPLSCRSRATKRARKSRQSVGLELLAPSPALFAEALIETATCRRSTACTSNGRRGPLEEHLREATAPAAAAAANLINTEQVIPGPRWAAELSIATTPTSLSRTALLPTEHSATGKPGCANWAAAKDAATGTDGVCRTRFAADIAVVCGRRRGTGNEGRLRRTL
mmetsp:Transcript_20940/g.72257  ORF Transcript_20940/g.72257 Transcript_20940/m.72257 type:complete len:299 (+) Transcript_20940:1349-2245(+)